MNGRGIGCRTVPLSQQMATLESSCREAASFTPDRPSSPDLHQQTQERPATTVSWTYPSHMIAMSLVMTADQRHGAENDSKF